MDDNKKVSKVKVISLILFIISIFFTATAAYYGVSLYVATLGSSDTVDSTGTAQGIHELMHLGSYVIIAASIIFLILSIIFFMVFIKSEQNSKNPLNKKPL